jgi:hypothetical protein
VIEPYYTKEQADRFHRIRDAAGGAAFDAAWEELVVDIKVHMKSGAGLTTDSARALARRWNELLSRFSGGDPEVERMLYEVGDKFYVNSQRQEARPPNILGYMRRVFMAFGQ